MSRLLVTGADGFVGRYLVSAARTAGMSVIGAIMPGTVPPVEWHDRTHGTVVEVVYADVTVAEDLNRMVDRPIDQLVHLAAIASGVESRRDPVATMQVNSTGSTWLIEAMRVAGVRPRVLFASTGEVYGAGHDSPIPETTPVNPLSAYAASKRAAEEALADRGAHYGIPVIIARAFPHTGPRQSRDYVLPALTARLHEAKRSGQREVSVGNLAVVRDFLDVRDVARAYLALLEHGVIGECYNVASGIGRRLSDCFATLADLIGVDAVAQQDRTLLRSADIPVLIGDASKLRTVTGWVPQHSFERTLQDLVDAQTY